MSTKLYVGNLSFRIAEGELHDAFGQFGNVTEVYLATDRVTGRPRGFAFVTFATPEEAKLATEKMNGAELDGRAISVSEAKARDEAGGTTVAGRTYTSPNRKAGAFHQRGNRRH
ncbi:RNA-binding protein [Opitutus sp. ER46]|uniref:RNA recognition motif domain-containing protein n=1 Tax=Opitutus sp. ER46 TaxID=2161864 RepID=UPI000D3256C4|nr:RNA-binding protein [Opitutus sp. ER46]PTX97922.1 RNA-binding protein [Opitutus sp. ER46]